MTTWPNNLPQTPLPAQNYGGSWVQPSSSTGTQPIQPINQGAQQQPGTPDPIASFLSGLIQRAGTSGTLTVPQFAQQQGWNAIGNNRYVDPSRGGFQGGGGYVMNGADFQGIVDQRNQAPGITQNDLRQAFLQDATRREQAEQFNWNRNNQQISAFDQFLGGMPGRIQDGTRSAVAPVLGWADSLERMGQQAGSALQSQANAATNAQGPNLQPMYDAMERSRQMSERAIASAEAVRNGFVDSSAQEASSFAEAIRQQGLEAYQQTVASFTPDMTEEEKQSRLLEVRQRTNGEVNKVLAPLYSTMQQVKAQLGTSVANMMAGYADRLTNQGQVVGQMEVAAANIRSQNRQIGANLAVEAQRLPLQMAEAAAQMRQWTAGVTQSALMSSVQLEMQGRGALAEMVRGNPYAPVSVFNGLLALAQIDRSDRTATWGGGMGSASRPQSVNYSSFTTPNTSTTPMRAGSSSGGISPGVRGFFGNEMMPGFVGPPSRLAGTSSVDESGNVTGEQE